MAEAPGSLDELHRCLDQLSGSNSGDAGTRARAALAAVRQELEALREVTAARAKSGSDWQAIAAEKDAEAVRLRAEINRMRLALSSTNQAHSTHAEEVGELQAQLQQALAINKAQQRQAVVTSSAAEGAGGELIRLRAELEARGSALERAEVELAAQQGAAAARLAEMQDSFIAKINEMRRTHQQQLEQAVAAARAAAASEAPTRTGPRAGAAAMEAQTAQRLQRAEADAIAVRQQLEAAQAAAAELQAKLTAARSEADSHKSQLSSVQFGEKALKARVKDLETQLAKAQRQLEAKPQPPQQQPALPPQPAPPVTAAPAGIDMGMISMMEGQLGRLSEIIRAREGELAQMRAALQAGLEERREHLRQIEALQAALQAAQQGGAGGGGGSGMGSPKSSASGPSPVRGLPHVSPNRPYRTGLTSKPKFK